MAVEGTSQRQSGGIVNTIANILVFTLCITALYAGRHYIAEMIAPVLGYSSNTVSAPLMATALPVPTIAPVAPQQQQVIIDQAPHAPRSVPTVQPAPVIEQAPVTSQEAPQEAVTDIPVSIVIPTAGSDVQASYASRTQGRCSMPRANPQTCNQPIPPMATPVGNP